MTVVQVTFKSEGKEKMLSYQFDRDRKTKAWKIFDVRYPDGSFLVNILKGEQELSGEDLSEAPAPQLAYQLIADTTSPDGRHALARGIDGVISMVRFLSLEKGVD